jgi:hypothetical protein
MRCVLLQMDMKNLEDYRIANHTLRNHVYCTGVHLPTLVQSLGGTSSTHGRYQKYVQNFRSGNMKGRDQSKDLGVCGDIML